MNALRLAALASLLLGVALIGSAALAGDVQVGLFLIIPFVATSSPLAGLGMLLVFAAIPLWFFSHVQRVEPMREHTYAREDGQPPFARDEGEPPRTERRARHGGVILLGPIPIVWGSDRGIARWMILAGALLLGLALLVALL